MNLLVLYLNILKASRLGSRGVKDAAYQSQGVLSTKVWIYPIFDVTATNLIKTDYVNLRSITMGTCDKTLNLVLSEAGFSVVSGAKVSVFMLFIGFVHLCLNTNELCLVLRENMVLVNTLEIKQNVKQRIK